jgi:hypothetical protein
MTLADLTALLARMLSRSTPSDPGVGSVDVTPGATVYAPPLRSLYCTGAGDVTFAGLDGVSATWTVPANFVIPVMMTAVTAATATGLKGIR